jgi:hypothetical protein
MNPVTDALLETNSYKSIDILEKMIGEPRIKVENVG